MQAGRGQDRADGNIAVDHVQMQLVAAPALLLALAVLLAAPVASSGQIVQTYALYTLLCRRAYS